MQSLMTAPAVRSPANDTTREPVTPVLEIEEGLLLVPLIGTIGSRRAYEITEQVLRAVERSRARVVLMDTTGVARIDGLVADRLLETVDAARLLGAQVILTGVSNRVAVTIVSSRTSVEGLECAADLRDGIEAGRQFLLGRRAIQDESGDRESPDASPRNGVTALGSPDRPPWSVRMALAPN